MSYLEELLPEFRKGAKIRIIGSEDNNYYYIKHNVIYNQNGTPIKDFSLSMVMADIWELYQEPIDWNYIIKNKCLCRFWDDDRDVYLLGTLAKISDVVGRLKDFKYKWNINGKYWKNCSPVRKDEVTFYEDKKDE